MGALGDAAGPCLFLTRDQPRPCGPLRFRRVFRPDPCYECRTRMVPKRHKLEVWEGSELGCYWTRGKRTGGGTKLSSGGKTKPKLLMVVEALKRNIENKFINSSTTIRNKFNLFRIDEISSTLPRLIFLIEFVFSVEKIHLKTSFKTNN